MNMYTYEEVLEKIENSRRFGNLPGVEVTRRALGILGHPEKGLPFIHVAGTNGKGSVCAFLSNILQEAGKKVGTFTSPHLIHFEERITINGKQISREDVNRLGNRLLDMDFGVTPTMFDYCLLMAVLYFQEQKCDIAVIETGLGGRLDSTNALGTPEVAVITKIGLDHTSILGDTLTGIAEEKAGILKSGCRFVMESQTPQVEQILKKKAKEAGVSKLLCITSKEIRRMESYTLKMPGLYQMENAAAARMAAILLLEREMAAEKEKYSPVPEETVCQKQLEAYVKNGLEQTIWPGRMQILSEKPFLLIDGAHNSHGVSALCSSLKAMYPGEKFHFVMGVMADKDYENMIREMLPLALDFQTITPKCSRGLQARKLAEYIKSQGVPACEGENPARVLQELPEEGKTVAFGSLYFIGELSESFWQRQKDDFRRNGNSCGYK